MYKPIYNLLHRHYHARYHGVYRHAKKLFVFDLALLGLAVAMLGASLFFFFWKPGTTDLIDLSLSIGSGRVRSGEKMILNIEYTNRSKFILHDTILALRLPPGFILLDTPPKTVFQIGKVAPGSTQEIKIAGQLWSNMKTDEKIVGSLTYRAEDNKETEQKISAMILNLPESVLSLSAEIPVSSFARANLPLQLTLQNTGIEKINNILLSHNWSGKIILNEDAKNLSLEAGASKTISGSLKTPDKNGAVPLRIFAQVNINNHPLAQAEVNQDIQIVSPQIFSKIEIPDTAFATPGDTLTAKITIKNNNAFAIQNAKIRLVSTLGVLNIPGTAQENKLKIEGNDLILNSQNRTLLANLEAGQSDEFTIRLKLRSHFSLAQGVKNFKIEPIVEAQLANLPDQKFSKTGVSATLPLTAEVSFSTVPVYYTADGEQMGRGPLPPQVGETTKYYIFINFANTLNNITNISMRAVLPAGIEMGQRRNVTVGQLMTYNPSDRAISWNYTELPAWSQTGLYFDVAVTPTADQIGQNITLLKDIQFSATDKITGKKFNFSVPTLNNVLKVNDPGFTKGSLVEAREEF